MKNIDLSIIIAAYNVENYLLQTLSSTLEVTSFSKEVIVINDGSTDGTAAILNKVLQSHPELIVIHQENQGLSNVRNLGIKEARGSYILFVDGDDFIDLRPMEAIIDQLKIEPREIVALPHIDLYPEGAVNFGFNRYLSNAIPSPGYRLLSNILKHRCYTSGVQFYLWNRSFIQKESHFFTPSVLHEDLQFTFIALLRANGCCYSTLAIYYYRRDRPGSITTSFNSQRIVSIAQILPSMASELQKSPAAHDGSIKNHLSAICLEIVHRIALEEDHRHYLDLFNQLNLGYYIKTYSASGRYKLASIALKILGYEIYCSLYKSLFFLKELALKRIRRYNRKKLIQ